MEDIKEVLRTFPEEESKYRNPYILIKVSSYDQMQELKSLLLDEVYKHNIIEVKMLDDRRDVFVKNMCFSIRNTGVRVPSIFIFDEKTENVVDDIMYENTELKKIIKELEDASKKYIDLVSELIAKIKDE